MNPAEQHEAELHCGENGDKEEVHTCQEGPFQLPPMGLREGEGCSIGMGELVIEDCMGVGQIHHRQGQFQYQRLPLYASDNVCQNKG